MSPKNKVKPLIPKARRLTSFYELVAASQRPREVTFQLETEGELLSLEVRPLTAKQSDRLAAIMDDVPPPPPLKDAAPMHGMVMRDYEDAEFRKNQRDAARLANALSIALAVPSLELKADGPLPELAEEVFSQLPSRVVEMLLQEIESCSSTDIERRANFISADGSSDSRS